MYYNTYKAMYKYFLKKVSNLLLIEELGFNHQTSQQPSN